MSRRRFVFVLAAVLLSGAAWMQPPKGELLVYFGTYTGAKSKGIYVSRLNLASGALSEPKLAAETPSPSFLALHDPRAAFIYAANEVNTFEGKPTGSVSAFAIDKSNGMLRLVNAQPSGGTGPAHVSVDPVAKHVLVANYGGGSVAVLPLRRDGGLEAPSSTIKHTGSSVNPQRQREPHAHAIETAPRNRFVYAADLGIDQILIYAFDPAKHTLAPATPAFGSVAPGAGPRHLAINAGGTFVYVINELNCTVTAFARDARTGALAEIQTLSTLPPGQSVLNGFSTAELHLHPSGRFLYGSNRGHDSIVVFAVDGKSGKLTYVENVPTGGKTPRGFGVTPAGDYLLAANQNSDSVFVFRIDRATGKLATVGRPITVGAPVDVKFVQP